MLKTLGRTTWEEIEVGEVFAWESCWCILVKLEDNKTMLLCTDHGISQNKCEGENLQGFHNFKNIYKLPLSTQRLWRQDT